MANPHEAGAVGASFDKHGLSHSRRMGQQQSPQTTALNPSLPAFQPGDMQLQHYQPPQELTPFQSALQTTPTHTAMSEMQHRLLEMNASHVLDIVKLTRQADAHGDTIEEFKEGVANNIRALEMRIDALSQQPQQSTIKALQTKDDFSPSQQMLDMFSKERIAELYLDEADEKQAWAEKLREQAGLLWPACIAKQEPKASTSPAREAAASHFTCETINAVVDVVVMHIDDVQAKHGRVDSAHGSPNRAGAPVTSQTLPHMCCDIEYVRVEDMIAHIQHCHAKLLKPDHVTGATSETKDSGTQTEVKTAKDCDVSAKSALSGDDVSSTATATSTWLPLAIRNLDALSVSEAAASHDVTFAWTFLRDILGGNEWSPGFYFNGRKDCFLPSRSYWLVDAKHDPFMPRTPGQHGAKITAFFNETTEGIFPDESNYMEAPVFVSADGGKTYRYMGMYSQTRFSDKIGYDTLMEHVPKDILHYHAEQLAKLGRPAWVTEGLKNHFWPKPVYAGPMPTDSACNTPKSIGTGDGSGTGLERRVQSALEEYALQLKEWEKDSAMKVQLLEPEAIFEAFNKEDIQPSPGLRLWWEYLQCVKYDDGFYDMLVDVQNVRRPSAPRNNIGPKPTPSLGQIKEAADIKKAEDSKKAGKAPAEEEQKPDDFSNWVSPVLNYPPPALYGAASKALQRKQNREQPGMPLSKIGPTRFVTPNFDDDEPGRPAASEQQQKKKKSPTTTAPKPAATAGSGNTTTKTPAAAATKALPPHLAVRNKAAPAPSTNDKDTAKTEPANPFATTGGLNEAKAFAQQATPARMKTVPPHLRNK